MDNVAPFVEAENHPLPHATSDGMFRRRATHDSRSGCDHPLTLLKGLAPAETVAFISAILIPPIQILVERGLPAVPPLQLFRRRHQSFVQCAVLS